jgi:hypothetical protein
MFTNRDYYAEKAATRTEFSYEFRMANDVRESRFYCTTGALTIAINEDDLQRLEKGA